jgi:hypothetical protein
MNTICAPFGVFSGQEQKLSGKEADVSKARFVFSLFSQA